MLVLGDVADVLVHGGVRGHDGERLDGDGVVAALELPKSGDDLIGLGLDAFGVGRGLGGLGGSGILGVVDHEHGGGAAGEFDEVEGADVDWRA